MAKPILLVENISKQYRLGYVGTRTLAHDANRWWHRIRGKDDPYLTIGSANDRSAKATEEYVWALKNISFEVQEGEVLGIIGKNGAGKSTLLKILSRVTGPTIGSIKSRGRIASLLEVGTGFNPELTGRENIYLNGTILGMTKKEVDAKIDEIIEFSGCEMYIDTPTKRYSSGMTVRLAFAVAAHLEPEILVIDEVLAVGDAEFQKKAIGKMQDISKGQGRTVLFVSHNMASVQTLCTRAIVLKNGEISFNGPVEDAITYYLKDENDSFGENVLEFEKGNHPTKENITLIRASIGKRGHKLTKPIKIDDEIEMFCEVETNDITRNIHVGFQFLDASGNILFMSQTRNANRQDLDFRKPGRLIFKGVIPEKLLNEGEFTINIYVVENTTALIEYMDALKILVAPMSKKIGERLGKSKGVFKTDFPWTVEAKSLNKESN
ncbi:ATP-binding cassette domain-containing protein [Aureisphaera sp. CAU 1614]|uniref:ATP-binding cassette domain-containing protein n=1 Tax=Halomarinibacterium sedimenti TaxID=2857106 RepID=A0A9X1FP09_9FLAO|nr:polysaccharide ABC transporter ATP-binding protein [Halomarinibacterium sedimenti]MBW2937733.1 ATP-binding cassette domain-containing protein [Halomarinibacterium sedimenti]